MLVGETGTPNLILLLAGLLLVAAGVAAFRFREALAEYLRDLRAQFAGDPLPTRTRKPAPPSRVALAIPIVVAVILIAFGLIGVWGGLFATLPPPGTRP
jgi:LPXTG-motif cell wall-anchored protein